MTKDMTITDLLNMMYALVDGHNDDCDCLDCKTLDNIQLMMITWVVQNVE